MTRMEALEAVAEAVWAYEGEVLSRGPYNSHTFHARNEMFKRRATLDALPAATPGEVVEVALGLWADAYGQTALFRADTVGDGRKAPGWTRLGTIRLALAKEAGDAG